eukprot:3981725-Lingulodinium_polyedra.AAC.1
MGVGEGRCCDSCTIPANVEHNAMNSDVEFHQPRIHIVEPATTYRTMPPASPNGGEANGAAV